MEELDRLNAQLSSLAAQMVAAKADGDVVRLDRLRALYRQFSADAAALRAELSGTEGPGGVATTLDKFGDEVIQVLKTAGQGIAELPGAAGGAIRNLPVILLLLVVGLYLWKRKG